MTREVSILEVYDERGEYTRKCMTREVSILEVYDERGEYTRGVCRER